ncbi:MAG: hypothetical protein U5K69_02770 [Balneolaceae bacterium]|nr:hypothetical protein [Balneolaceae bacterium]
MLWDVPERNSEAARELDTFESLNIRYLELRNIVSDDIWEEIQERDFQVYVQVPVRYPVVQTFVEDDSSLVALYQQFLNGYTGRNIEAIGAFAYGQTNEQDFNQAAAPFASQLNSGLPVPIYFKDWNLNPQPTDSLFDFKISKVNVNREFDSVGTTSFTSAHAFIYNPDKSIAQKVAPLKWFFEKTAVNQEAILFFDSNWLLQFIERHQATGKTIAEHAVYQDAVFPLPNEQISDRAPHSLLVLILLAVWGMLALSYSFVPMYRHSLFRFFLSHQFFIEDVMKRHIRAIFPSLIVLIQHAVLGGIFLYCLIYSFISPQGLEVLHSYVPFLTFWGSGYYSFFLIGSLATLVFELISLLWLYIANKRIGYLSQISILYSWPFHLNLLITTIIVTMMMASINVYIISIFLALFFLVLLIDFPITAYDAGKKISKGKFLYALSTLGLYSLLVATAFFMVFTNSYLLNILELAITIS